MALLRTKDEYLDALNALIIQLGFAPKVIRIDNAGEMNSAKAYEFYEAMRIWVEVCNAYEHHQSGRVESAIGSISMRLRVMLVSSGLPLTYWGFACRYAVEIENRFLPTRPDSNVTCYEAFHGHAPKNALLQPFGCLAFLHVDVDRRPIKKLSETSVTCVFLGFAYHIGHKGYMLKQIGKRRYFVAMRSVTFDPERFPYLKPVRPEDARWAKPGEENDQPVLDFGSIEDVDQEEIEVPEPSEIEVVLEDFEDERCARRCRAERADKIDGSCSEQGGQ